jgi:hypothetical protein
MLHVIAALEGREGVLHAEPDAQSRTVRVLYDPVHVSNSQLLDVINLADVRLQAHHRLRKWLGSSGSAKRTAEILSDDPA